MTECVYIDFDVETVTKEQLEGHLRTLAYWKQRLYPKAKPVPVPPAETLALPPNARVVFTEDWRDTDRIAFPSETVAKRRWSNGSDVPNAEVNIVTAADGSRQLEAVIHDTTVGDSDGARAFMTMDDARWNDLPALEGQTVFWHVTAALVNVGTLAYGAGRWFSLAELKRAGDETPAGIQVNVRGDRGYPELYLVLDGKSYYHPAPTPLTNNTPFTFLLEVQLSRTDGAVWLTHNGVRFGGAASTMGADGLAAFALTSYGNTQKTLTVRFGEVVFGTVG